MTVSARVNAERIVLFGWSRAILLQLAHPLVAAGVAGHSTFRTGVFGAAVRLHHTVRAMTRLTFGTPDEHAAALAGIRRIHQRVNGRLPDRVGPFAAGTPYSAEDPALVLWVHATLLESLPMVYERLVAPLTPEERDAYCREGAPLARALGAGDDVPESWEALTAYMQRMYASGQIAVGPAARDVADAVLAPPLGMFVAPARAMNRTMTLGLLPPVVRDQYGWAWSPSQDASLRRTLAVLRALHRAAPRRLRHWPEARRRPSAL